MVLEFTGLPLVILHPTYSQSMPSVPTIKCTDSCVQRTMGLLSTLLNICELQLPSGSCNLNLQVAMFFQGRAGYAILWRPHYVKMTVHVRKGQFFVAGLLRGRLQLSKSHDTWKYRVWFVSEFQSIYGRQVPSSHQETSGKSLFLEACDISIRQ